MKNFGRALKDAYRFWPLLLIATLCSIGNGAIWGLNIGALFPVIEVTIAGESLQHWIADEIAEGESRAAELQQQIAALQNADELNDIARASQSDQLTMRRDAELVGVASSRRLQPYIDRYLPNDPFETVLYVMAAVMVCTGIKHVFQFLNTALVALVAARITRRIQTKIFAKSLQLDPTTFSHYSSSGFAAHITMTLVVTDDGDRSRRFRAAGLHRPKTEGRLPTVARTGDGPAPRDAGLAEQHSHGPVVRSRGTRTETFRQRYPGHAAFRDADHDVQRAQSPDD
jgi:ABC-type multidrug transport system fused ATPase/permease subunit